MRGLDVYKFDAGARHSTSDGTWMTPAQAQALRARQPKVVLTKDTAFFCLLPQG